MTSPGARTRVWGTVASWWGVGGELRHQLCERDRAPLVELDQLALVLAFPGTVLAAAEQQDHRVVALQLRQARMVPVWSGSLKSGSTAPGTRSLLMEASSQGPDTRDAQANPVDARHRGDVEGLAVLVTPCGPSGPVRGRPGGWRR